jgi:hypothetical protein
VSVTKPNEKIYMACFHDNFEELRE